MNPTQEYICTRCGAKTESTAVFSDDELRTWQCPVCDVIGQLKRFPPPSPAPETILDEAARLVAGERRDAYGPVEESFARAATVWSAVLKTTITPHQVALCMVGLKLCREANAHKRDNLVDLAAYAYLANEVVSKEVV